MLMTLPPLPTRKLYINFRKGIVPSLVGVEMVKLVVVTESDFQDLTLQWLQI